MSFQKGSIEEKGSGKYLLRYRIRDVNHPSGWRKASELIEAVTDKAAEKERDWRMREINSKNEASSKREEGARSVPTFGEFSKTLWVVYLKNRRVKHSTVDSYGSVLRHNLSPVSKTSAWTRSRRRNSRSSLMSWVGSSVQSSFSISMPSSE